MSAAAGGPPSGGVNSITGLSSATTARINCSLDGPWEPAQVPALVVMSIMYGLVTLFALAGNGLVCYIVLAYPRMRTVTNMFIVNLAVGDILMAVFCIPFSFVSNFITEHWVFGYFMCIAVGYCQAISYVRCGTSLTTQQTSYGGFQTYTCFISITVMVSAYTLIAISMDRYLAIMYPLKPRLNSLQARLIIGIVWAVALVTPLPSALRLTLKDHPDCPGEAFQYCAEDWSSAPELELYYSYGLLTLQYLLPLLVLIVTYARIAITVWGKEIPGEAEHQRDCRMAQSKRKMVKMMICVVSVFSLCWMPLNVYILLMMIDPVTVSNTPYVGYAYFFCHWLAMSHTCYNPVIYCWLNANFRQGFTRLFCSRAMRGSQRKNTYTSYVSCNQSQVQQLHTINDNNLESVLHRCNSVPDIAQQQLNSASEVLGKELNGAPPAMLEKH